MVIYFPLLTDSVHFHPRMKQNLHKGNHLGKDQPNINHLHIGCGGEALGDTDEEGCENKEGGEVNCHYSFKKEVFEEVCSVDYDEDKDCWEVDSQDCIVDSSFQNNSDMYSSSNVSCMWLFLWIYEQEEYNIHGKELFIMISISDKIIIKINRELTHIQCNGVSAKLFISQMESVLVRYSNVCAISRRKSLQEKERPLNLVSPRGEV